MIILRDVSLSVPQTRKKATTLTARRTILSDTTISIPTDRRIALLGGSNQDNTAFLNLLGGVVIPSRGTISRLAKVSFPAGHLGSFSHELSVRSNVAHFARLYDVDRKSLIALVERVAHLGPAFEEPYGRLKSLQKRDLSQVISFSIPFDVYILCSGLPQPDKRRGENVYNLFLERTRHAGMIVQGANLRYIKKYFEMILILHQGKLRLFDDIDYAVHLAQKVKFRASLK